MAQAKHYIVILCGGTGPRLWPLSRTANPKQFLPLLGKQSLLQQTISRCQKIVPLSQIFLISNIKYLSKIKKHLGPKFPSQNIISEPDKKNTAMAILYAATIIQSKNPHSVITTLPSDHYIKNHPAFKKDLVKSARLAQKLDRLVILGTKALFANPSYGYVKAQNGQVSDFIEKPPLFKIPTLIAKKYYWNLGIYNFTPTRLFLEFQQCQPVYYRLYLKLKNKILSDSLIKNIYRASPSLSIDTAISQKSKNLVLLPAKFDWSDVGEWKTIYHQLKKDRSGFAFLNSQTLLNQYQSKNCLVSGQKDKLIGLVGIENLTIIDTPDSLLICQTKKSFRVRKLIGQIVKNKKHKKFFVSPHDK